MDLMNSGAMLAIFGYFGFILKDIPSRILDIFLPRMCISLAWDTTGLFLNRFYENNRWLIDIDKSGTLFRHIQISSGIFATGIEIKKRTIINDGRYYIFPSKFTVCIVDTYTQKASTGASDINRFVTATFYGKDAKKFKKDYIDYLKRLEEDHNDTISLSRMTGTCSSSGDSVPKRPFDTVFTKYNDEIKSRLDKFKSNSRFYKESGLTYKIGFLFFGPPGSGKSSLVRAMASYTGWDILYIDINTYNIADAPSFGKQIVLIEDIDCLSINRDPEKGKGGTSLQTLLNYIDGPLTPSETIFVATTNHIENLDPALIRPGRFDHQYLIDYIDKDMAKEMCKVYEADESILDDIEFPVSPAIIQNKILYLKNTLEKEV